MSENVNLADPGDSTQVWRTIKNRHGSSIVIFNKKDWLKIKAAIKKESPETYAKLKALGTEISNIDFKW